MRSKALIVVLGGLFVILAVSGGFAQRTFTTVVVDANAPSHPFPHFWEKTFGSGRAILALRESYRNDLREVKKVTEFSYVRFHAIFHDELGVYDEDEQGNPVYNFSYVDQVYDGLLKNGVRPFVEISFMPKKLALRQDIHPFWYKQNVAPPKDYVKWDGLIRAFAQHLVNRYGIEEVAKWYFEVWNEPNIDFWSGEPKQASYFELYEHTARTLKSVSPRLRVGGPSTAAADWVDVFLDFAGKKNVPVDFVSSHAYGDDTVENLFHNSQDIPMDQRVCRAIRKVHDQIKASSHSNLPLMWTEWNVPGYGERNAHDAIWMGPSLAEHVWQCDGLVDMTSFWTFSDVFEENGPKREPFDGGFGIMAMGGIKKPAYNAFALLHKLGDKRIVNSAPNVLVTRRAADGTVVIAVWNRVDPGAKGEAQGFDLAIKGVPPGARAIVRRLDETHGNTLAAYEAMGRPRYPTQAQVEKLNRAADLGPPDHVVLHGGHLPITVPVNGLAVIEIPKRLASR